MALDETTWKNLRSTIFVRAFAFLKIPLLASVRPTILHMDANKTVLKIPLRRWTKNHLNSMYFGALTMGGEAAVGISAAQSIQNSGKKVDFLFKDFSVQFLKRADGDVHFICEEIAGVTALIDKAINSGERENQTFHSYAIVPSNDPKVHVAEFQVTMTVKSRSPK